MKVGGGASGWGVDPLEGYLDIKIQQCMIRKNVDGHLPSLHEDPFNAKLEVFRQFPWQLFHKIDFCIKEGLVLCAYPFKRGPAGCDLVTVIS